MRYWATYGQAIKSLKNHILCPWNSNLDPTWRNLARSWTPKIYQVGQTWFQVGPKMASCWAWNHCQMNSKKTFKKTPQNFENRAPGPLGDFSKGWWESLKSTIRTLFFISITPRHPFALEAHGGYIYIYIYIYICKGLSNMFGRFPNICVGNLWKICVYTYIYTYKHIYIYICIYVVLAGLFQIQKTTEKIKICEHQI